VGKLNAVDKMEFKTYVIWGVPQSHLATRVQESLERLSGPLYNKCYWRGEGGSRHIAAEFHIIPDNARKNALKMTCKSLGWKAIPARRWKQRCAHRTSRMRDRSSKGYSFPVENRYEIIEPQIQLEEANPANVQGQAGSNDPAHARKQRPADQIKVGSFNAEKGLKDKIGELEEFATKHRYDAVAVQEADLKKGKAPPPMKGFVAFPTKGTELLTQVVWYVRSFLAPFVSQQVSTHKNQLWIRLAGCSNMKNLFLCNVYGRQERAPKEERAESFDCLLASSLTYKTRGEIAIYGDINAKIGRPKSPEEIPFIGELGEACARSSNGSLLADTIISLGLVNLLGQSAPSQQSLPEGTPSSVRHWYTRYDKPSDGYHTLDYVLLSSVLAEAATVWVDYTNLPSSHNFVGSVISCPRKIVKRKGRKPSRRVFKTEKLIQRSSRKNDVEAATSNKDQYETELKKAFEGYSQEANAPVAAAVTDFVQRTMTALESSVGSKSVCPKFSRSWFNEEAKLAVHIRRDCYAAFKKESSSENWAAYTAARRTVTRIIKKNKSVEWQEFLDGFNSDFKTDHKSLWNRVRRLVPSEKTASLSPILKQDGSLASSEEEILDAWADHYEALGTPSTSQHFDQVFHKRVQAEVKLMAKHSPSVPDTTVDAVFTHEEVEEVLERLLQGDYKAGSTDGTRNPWFSRGGPTMVNLLLSLFNFLREREVTPENWSEATIVNLYKDGDRCDAGNYRGISLLSCLGKIYSSLWANRLSSHFENVLNDAQGGFRKHRSTVDDALALREILCRRRAENKDTFMFFIDFKKAFDTVWQDGLWRSLWHSGVKGKAWRIIRSLYANTSSRVKVGSKLSREFRIKQGVRQGCPLSPTLFNCFVNELIVSLGALGVGVQVGHKRIDGLLYADDVVLLAESPETLQAMINKVDEFSRKWRMELNLKKSEVMIVRPPIKMPFSPPPSFSYRGSQVRIVPSYKYLGIWFTSNLQWEKHIEYMITNATERTKSMRALLTTNRIPVRAKLLVWLSSVRPLLEYGSEVWEADAKQWAKIERAQREAGIQAMKLNKNTKAEAVLGLMKATPLEARMKRSRLNYLGKLYTMDPDRIARYVILDLPQRRSPDGRPLAGHWRASTLAIVAKNPELKPLFRDLRQATRRAGGILPREGDAISPLKTWRRGVQAWHQQSLLQRISSEADQKDSSTLKLIARACRHTTTLPKFTATRLPNTGPNQIRLRLLGGTSGLNVTMGRISTSRGTNCPWGCGVAETPIHFLLHCKAYTEFRTTYLQQIEAFCQQPHDRKEDDSCRSVTCSCFFGNLDEEGKAVFMLGGPVVWGEGSEPWSPEDKVDKAALHFVLKAYKKRSENLEAKFGLVEDLTCPAPQPPKHKIGRPQQAKITQHFVARSVHPHPNTNTHIARPQRPVSVRKGSGSHRQSSTESP
jgi:hypothetical protein